MGEQLLTFCVLGTLPTSPECPPCISHTSQHRPVLKSHQVCLLGVIHTILFFSASDFTAILRAHLDHCHERVTASVSPSIHLHTTLRGATRNTSLCVPLLCCKLMHSLRDRHPSDRPVGWPSLPVSSYRLLPAPTVSSVLLQLPGCAEPSHHVALSSTPRPPGKPLLLQRHSLSILGLSSDSLQSAHSLLWPPQ